MTKLDIIIPAYNLGKHIIKTLKSLENQTMKEFRVIIIDDGSTDNTLSIIKEYILLTKINIDVYSQKNQGVSIARNTGISKSLSEYILFLDGDDFIDQNYLKLMYNKITKKNSDFAYCGFDIVDDDEVTLTPYKYTYIDNISNEECIINLLKKKLFFCIGTFIFKRTLILENNIRFSKNIRYGEDQVFVLELLTVSSKICSVDKVLFHYLKRDGSVTSDKSSIVIGDAFITFNKLFFLMKENKNISEEVLFWFKNYKIPYEIIKATSYWAEFKMKKYYFDFIKKEEVRFYLKDVFKLPYIHKRIILKSLILLYIPTLFYSIYKNKLKIKNILKLK